MTGVCKPNNFSRLPCSCKVIATSQSLDLVSMSYFLFVVNHMRKVEGSVFVLFTGLTPKVMNVITSTATDRAAEKVRIQPEF